MFTKDQFKIMQVFVSKINKRFSIRRVAQTIGKDPSQIHKAIQPLIKQNFINVTEEKQLTLNYQKHFTPLAYIEHLRYEDFINKPGNRVLRIYIDDIFRNIKDEYFILILFGSAVEEKKYRDIDLLAIVDTNDKIEDTERFLFRYADKYSKKFDINVIGVESVYEMAGKREELNVLNELLNNHIILYGGEIFYRLLKNARR